MRYLKLVLLVGVIICAGCNDALKSSNHTKRFIPGTYVKEVKNEFLIAYDTLIIQCSSGNNYLIVNRTAYQRIRNNKLYRNNFPKRIGRRCMMISHKIYMSKGWVKHSLLTLPI